MPQAESHVTDDVTWLPWALRATRWTRSTVNTQERVSSPELHVAEPLVHALSPSLRVTTRVPRSIEMV